jgi:hypothetical protein
MDDTERHVAGFLASKGYQDNDFVYEPDGKVPPDFVLLNRIAIEVRRLNQNYDGAIRTEGLEETAIPLFHQVKKLVESFGPPTGEHSWFVCYRFARPELPWPTLRPLLKEALSNFAEDPSSSPTECRVGNTLKISFIPSSSKFDTLFVMGAHTDMQTGGFIVSEMIRNLEICVIEKTSKIARYKARYPEWWLILVDRISYGTLDSSEIETVRKSVQHMQQVQCWNKIVIIDSESCSRSFEL